MRVIYRHYRICSVTGLMYRRRRDGTEVPATRGGMTQCIILDGSIVVGVGIALCSLKDNFCYRIGRDIARGRAEVGMFFRWPKWAKDCIPAYFWWGEEGRTEGWIKKWVNEIGEEV